MNELDGYWQLGLVVFLASLYALCWLRAANQDQPEPKKIPVSGAVAGTRCSFRGMHGSGQRRSTPAPPKPVVPKPELRQDSKVPVQAPSFESQDFDSQVAELLSQVTPTPESDRLASELAECARAAIHNVFPEVEVAGFASGDVVRGTAFGVAVPELDIVVTASPHVLVQHLQGRLSKCGMSMAKLDARKLQKSAIRVCTDQLVSVGGFKFRRSAFRGQEPKVTLMAPASLGVSGKGIPVDFSVNCVAPLYNNAILAECGAIDKRAQLLILIVRRWAKDRGVCHAAKGHLAPYAWTLLAVYFLQVGLKDAAMLPPLQGFKMASGLAIRHGTEADAKRGKRGWEPPPADGPAAKMPVGRLLQEFYRFFAQEIDWHSEAVSVRLGRRASANLHLMLHIIVHEDQTTEVGPSIEDPFEPARNLGTSTTSVGIARLKEEFTRAHSLMSKGASLPELLAPWAPAERARGSSEDCERDEEGGACAAQGPRLASSSEWPAPETCWAAECFKTGQSVARCV